MTAPTLPARPTLPPSNPVRPQPVVVVPGPNTAARARVRTQWLLLAAALTVLAGTRVAWALTRAAARVDVVSIARPVPAGAVIDDADLSVTAIAFDDQVTGLVPAASRERLIGRSAAIALEPGTLLSVGMWADGSELGEGERTVGALLDPGRFPAGTEPGTRALAIGVSAGAAGPSPEATSPMTVRVLEATLTDQGELQVTLAAADADAIVIARLAATDMLVLVGLPAEAAGDAADDRATAGEVAP